MAKDLINIENKWIYQSNHLIEACYSMTPLEHKFIRVLSSMIDKEDKEFYEYRFKVLSLGKLLSINPKNIYREMDKLSDLLMERFIKVRSNAENPKDYEKYHFIEKIKYIDGEGEIIARISREMNRFYLSLGEFYTKYKLKNVIQFKYKYTFRIYELLKQYQNIGERTFSIGELKTILDIGKDEYKLYGDFKKRVIIQAQKELYEKTDIEFSFKDLEKGQKSVKNITFYIRENSRNISTIENDNSESNKKSLPTTKGSNINITGTIAGQLSFELSSILQYFKQLYGEDLEAERIQYLLTLYSFDEINKKVVEFKNYIYPGIQNITSIFIDYIQNPGKYKERSYNKIPQISNFEQRKYDDEYYQQFINNKKE